jgi:hypothetical protein
MLDETFYTFFFLSVRDPRTDFRRDLVTALRELGHEVTYIRLGRKCFVEGPREDSVRFVSPHVIVFKMIRATLAKRKVIVFNSVNLGFPLFCTVLRALTWRSVWCFDIHDNLLYESKGARRLISQIKLAWLQAIATFCVRAAPTLIELSPKAFSLCNASSVTYSRRNGTDWTKILVLSNIDARFDFELLCSISNSNLEICFEIYGSVAKDHYSEEKFDKLQKNINVLYKGPYISSDIPSILKKYVVTFAPYRLDSSTRYIDPLRFYHCLNSGIEIITTPIPRALDMRESMHLISTAAEFSVIIDGLISGTTSLRNRRPRPPITWVKRGAELIEIIERRRQSAHRGRLH